MILSRRRNEKKLFNQLYQSILIDGHLLYIGSLLEHAAQKFADRIALIYNDEMISYRELYRRAAALTIFLKKRDVKPGDRIIICFENSPEFYVAYYAALQAGAVVAPVNTFLKEYELAHIIKDAQPRLIITAADRVVLFQKADGDQVPPIISADDFPAPSDSLVPEPSIVQEPDALAALLYTSGTTGLPKGVMLSSKNIMTNVIQGISYLQGWHGDHERLLGVLPLFHVFAQNVCVWSPMLIGATVILVPKIDRRYILSALKYKPTGFFGVPALYGLFCLLKTAPLDSVKYFISGGDAMPDKIRTYFELLYRRKICNGYGLTETSPLIAIDSDDVAQPTNTIGKPRVGVSIEIRDPDGNVLPPGQIGQLWVKGDNIMLGYYNAPEETAKVLKDGWFNTGDTMYIDEHGKLVVTGRTKDLIIHKGINIYPQEIENIIMLHPNVLRVGVIGVSDNTYGEMPIAYVQLRQEQTGIEKELKNICMQKLASYKVPRTFICSVDELPVTAINKVDKKVLRKRDQK